MLFAAVWARFVSLSSSPARRTRRYENFNRSETRGIYRDTLEGIYWLAVVENDLISICNYETCEKLLLLFYTVCCIFYFYSILFLILYLFIFYLYSIYILYIPLQICVYCAKVYFEILIWDCIIYYLLYYAIYVIVLNYLLYININ